MIIKILILRVIITAIFLCLFSLPLLIPPDPAINPRYYKFINNTVLENLHYFVHILAISHQFQAASLQIFYTS